MSLQNKPFVRKECLMCKRKFEDMPEEKRATKIAKNDIRIDIDAEIEDKFNQLPPLPALKKHPRFLLCTPPEAPVYHKYSVFLAGSIEMGKAVQWQKHMADFLSPLPITVNNPRRGKWDPRATQEAKNEAFRHQVEWELCALEKADVICFFFDVNTMSPVTMLELGIWAQSKKVVVCCDKRFWRAGNIHIVCDRYKIPLVETFEGLVPLIEGMLEKKGMKLDNNGDLIK
jgi:nucleoside 2-deoxyribosyltransferase